MRGTVVTIHTVHEVEGQFIQFLVRNIDAFVSVDGFRPIAAYYFRLSRNGREQDLAGQEAPFIFRLFPGQFEREE